MRHPLPPVLVALIVVGSIGAGCSSPPPTREGMKFIEGGTYTVGAEDGEPRPVTEVNIPRGFFMDTHEVTNAEYRSFCLEEGHEPPASWGEVAILQEIGETPRAELDQEVKERYDEWGELPVTGVTFQDARAYARWADKRLPSQDEWEAAARGPDGSLYPWGDETPEDEGDVANVAPVGPGEKQPVGSYPDGRTPTGLHDMCGNVWEWTTTLDPDNREQRIIKGGSFDLYESDHTMAQRGTAAPDETRPTLGFRCAADAP